MRIVAGVDWSDEAFAAVEQIGLLYRPDDVVLVHGVDLGMFQSPIVAGAVNLQGYEEFRQALNDAGHQAERCHSDKHPSAGTRPHHSSPQWLRPELSGSM